MTTRQRRDRRPAALSRLRGVSSARPSPSRHPATDAPAAHAGCRGRLKIGYQITADRLQGQVEFAYRTDWTQVLTTILWGGRIDDVSRRTLTDALRAAADEARPVRIHAFAAAARDLFRRTAQTLAARRRSRARRGRFGHPSRDGPSDTDNFIPEVGSLHHELLAAIDDLHKADCHQPRVTIVEGADAAHVSLQDALSALQGLFDSMDDYLEQVLQPLTLPVNRHALHAFILETRRELDELATSRAVGGVYVETLAVTESDDNATNLEVEGWLGAAVK